MEPNSAKPQINIGACWGCRIESVLYRKYKVDLCEWCILLIATKYSKALPWCSSCEEKVVSIEDHLCSGDKSVDWLDLLAKLR